MLISGEAWRENEVIGFRLRADHGGPNMPGEPILRSTLLPYSTLRSLDEIRIIRTRWSIPRRCMANLLGNTRFGKQIVDGDSDRDVSAA
jgi:hypothetical protein